MQLRRMNSHAAGPSLSTLLDPANDVAYKMIGGAYRVLGAEVLGHFVPRALDEDRFGIYVREAGVAWLCRELAPTLTDYGVGELPHRMARAVAAHHDVHAIVERAVSEARGTGAYLDLLARQAPRHGPSEERLAELQFQSEARSGLDHGTRQLLEGPLDELMARAPEGADKVLRATAAELVAVLNVEYSLETRAEDYVVDDLSRSVPCYLVMEPHLPEHLASEIRRALLG